jgi:hypothetical protein
MSKTKQNKKPTNRKRPVLIITTDQDLKDFIDEKADDENLSVSIVTTELLRYSIEREKRLMRKNIGEKL